MKEIINLSVGQCGNQVGLCFWEAILNEHSINLNGEQIGNSDFQREKIDTYFTEIREGKYQPRSLQIDSEQGTIDSILQRPIGQLFNIDSFSTSQYTAGNSFGKGKYEMEFDTNPDEQIRIFSEQCDSLQGFQIIRSLGGGTGSGFADLLLQQLNDEYPQKIMSNFCIFPSPLVSDTVVEPYNAVLCMPGLIENCDLCFFYDNSALYGICTRNLKIKQPVYKDLNSIIAQSMSGVTSCWRFPTKIYNDMRRMSMNLIPFQRLHFLNTSLAPLVKQEMLGSNINVQQMISMLKHNRNFLCQSNNFDKQLEFSSISVFRGEKICEQEVEEQQLNAYQFDKRYTPTFIPDNQRYIINSQKFNNNKQESALKITNNTSILEMMQITEEKFNAMFKRKAYLFGSYKNMDEMEFTEAQSILKDLIEEYQQLENTHEYTDLNLKNEDVEQENQEISFQDKVNAFIQIQF